MTLLIQKNAAYSTRLLFAQQWWGRACVTSRTITNKIESQKSYMQPVLAFVLCVYLCAYMLSPTLTKYQHGDHADHHACFGC